MDNSLRPLPLPEDVPGRVWLTAMPGRFGSLSTFVDAASHIGVTRVVCLVTGPEIAAKSPAYAEARQLGTLPLAVQDHPIPDYGLPEDPAAFADFIKGLCADLQDGQRMILHCAAGIGRTGVVSQHLLMALGVDPVRAQEQVLRAGSHPETAEQRLFCTKPVVLSRTV